MQFNTTEIMTVEELMELLHIGKSTVYQLLDSGEIRAFRIGRKWKIPKEAVCEYIQRKTNRKLQIKIRSKKHNMKIIQCQYCGFTD